MPTLLKNALYQVIKDPTFKTGRPEAATARDCAVDLIKWTDDPRHQKDFTEFCSKLDKDFSNLLSDRLTTSSNRERMWRDYFYTLEPLRLFLQIHP